MHDQQSLFTIFGAMYVSTLILGINNSAAVIPYVSTERTVLYRERYSGMYAPWAYAFAQVVVEVPYLLAQTIVCLVTTYPMIGYYWSASKFFWYFYTIFCTVMYFNYLGMLIVSMTPSFPVAAILQSFFYTTFTLFSGFFVPQPQIPKWWLWLYYATPTSWTMNALLTSQYGDVQTEVFVFGKSQKVAEFVKDYFGFHHDRLALTGVILILFPIAFASLFAYFIGRLNFQRR